MGFDFTNILLAAFTRADHKNTKQTDNLTVFFVLLGYAGLKAARKHVGKNDPRRGRNV
jgi:hypothetical protein